MPNNSRYRWPAEWEPQSRVWLSWPHNRDTWPGLYRDVPTAFKRFAETVAEAVPVCLLIDEGCEGDAQKHLGTQPDIDFVPVPTNDCWIRDYGPTFVIDNADGEVAGIDWQYNAWGGKYPPWDLDAKAAQQILAQCSVARLASKLTLEGGAIETDGLGLVLSTNNAVLTKTRNPNCSRTHVESELSQLLGAAEFVWLETTGLAGDDTDGHIDQLARFIDPNNLVVATCEDLHDPNYQPLEENFRFLSAWALDHHRDINVHRLPIPPIRTIKGQRVPESYCNFLFAGETLIVPTFGAVSDDFAVSMLTELLPHRHVIGLDASPLSWGLGAFHCMSQQQPAGMREN